MSSQAPVENGALSEITSTPTRKQRVSGSETNTATIKENLSTSANRPSPSITRSARKSSLTSIQSTASGSYGTPAKPRRSSHIRDNDLSTPTRRSSQRQQHRNSVASTTPMSRGRSERASSLPTSLVQVTPSRRSGVRGRTSSLSSNPKRKLARDDAVRVLVRIKPVDSETPQSFDGGNVLSLGTLSFSSENKQILTIGASNGTLENDGFQQSFTFDSILPPTVSQEQVFREVGRPITDYALQGINASIFAYGQTGSGKTFTMEGESDNPVNKGLIPRVLEHLFTSLEKKQKSRAFEYQVKCNFTEIYNEDVYDLLDTPSADEWVGVGSSSLKRKPIREDIKRGVFVEGLKTIPVLNTTEALAVLEEGSKQRRVGETNMNHLSSRSHSIFSLDIQVVEKLSGNDGIAVTKSSRINLVDLAGSERQQQTKSEGERLREAKHINRSLSALGNVISALVDKSQGKARYHVPHRDSALTFLLKDSLGGNTKTAIVTTVSPHASNFQDTLSTLKFGKRAKAIKNQVEINTDLSGSLEAYKQEVQTLSAKLLYYKEQEKKWMSKALDNKFRDASLENDHESDSLPAPPIVTKSPPAPDVTQDSNEVVVHQQLLRDDNYKVISKEVDKELNQVAQLEKVLMIVLSKLRIVQDESSRKEKAIESFRESEMVLQSALDAKAVVKNQSGKSESDAMEECSPEAHQHRAQLVAENKYLRLLLEKQNIPFSLLQSEQQKRPSLGSPRRVVNSVDQGSQDRWVSNPQELINRHLLFELEREKRTNALLLTQLEVACEEKDELVQKTTELESQVEQQKTSLDQLIQESLKNNNAKCGEATTSPEDSSKVECEHESRHQQVEEEKDLVEMKSESNEVLRKQVMELQDQVFIEREKYETLKAKFQKFDVQLEIERKQKCGGLRFSLGDSHPNDLVLQEVETTSDVHQRRVSTSPIRSQLTNEDTLNMERAKIQIDFEFQKIALQSNHKTVRVEDEGNNTGDKLEAFDEDETTSFMHQKPTTMLEYRNQNHSLLLQNKRLELRIETMQHKLNSERRLSRKSISTVETLSSKDQQELLAVQIENDKLRTSNEQLSLTNRELMDTVDEQRKFAEFKSSRDKQELATLQQKYEGLQEENKRLTDSLERLERDSNAAVAAMNLMRSRQSVLDRSRSSATIQEHGNDSRKNEPVGVEIVTRLNGPSELDEEEADKRTIEAERLPVTDSSSGMISNAEIAAAVRRVSNSCVAKGSSSTDVLLDIEKEANEFAESQVTQSNRNEPPAIVRRTFANSIVTGDSQTTSQRVVPGSTPTSLLKGSFRVKSKKSVAELFPSTPSKDTETAKRLAAENLLRRESIKVEEQSLKVANQSGKKGWSSLLKFSR